MPDLHEIVHTNCGQSTPMFWVSVEDAKKLLDEIHRLRAGLARVTADRDKLLSLEDCREHLRTLGRYCGCDHVDSPDERLQQVRHIEEAFERLRDANHELRGLVMTVCDAWERQSADPTISCGLPFWNTDWYKRAKEATGD